MDCLRLGCIIICVAINNAAGGGCRGSELGVTQEELTVAWGDTLQGVGNFHNHTCSLCNASRSPPNSSAPGEFITNTGLDSLVRHTSPQFVYMQRIGPQRNLAGKGFFFYLVFWNVCKVRAAHSINIPWRQKWPRYNWYSGGWSITKMTAES